MRTGFACLFYGGPGTGKTETARQIAKATGRSVMQVDISSAKGCWVGESEKITKGIFERYRKAVENANIVPILLFNEADAIINKRQELGKSWNGPLRMENAVQNIILQEMETFDGILIATSNMAQNMDEAFERRFLYKIKFEMPTLTARESIWKAMIPELPDEDITVLAKEFDFSGGQIENITRRCTTATVLYGRLPNLDELITYCREEQPELDGTKHIGFVTAQTTSRNPRSRL